MEAAGDDIAPDDGPSGGGEAFEWAFLFRTDGALPGDAIGSFEEDFDFDGGVGECALIEIEHSADEFVTAGEFLIGEVCGVIGGEEVRDGGGVGLGDEVLVGGVDFG